MCSRKEKKHSYVPVPLFQCLLLIHLYFVPTVPQFSNTDPDSQIQDSVLDLGFLLNPDQMTRIDQTVQG
jgi:hypothetical protein